MANLTQQQLQAVTDQGGKLLVSAAAGSGKTMVLVERLMRYILDPVSPANIDDFLIITYTKAAAAELREKIAKKINELLSVDSTNRHLRNQLQRIYLAKISTVHGFCTEILRENAYRLDIPGDFRVAEEDECLQLQDMVLDQLLEEVYGKIQDDADLRCVVDTQGFGRNDKKLPEVIIQIYRSAQCHLDPDGWLDKCVAESEITDIQDASQTVWGRYLIDDLHQCLDLHIPAMRQCAEAARSAEGMEKAAVLLDTTVAQLEALRSQQTWQGVHNNLLLQFGTMTFGKTADPELKEQIKAVRDACKEALLKKQAVFSYENAQIIAELGSCTSVVRGLAALVRRFSEGYALRKQKRCVLDFADLEHKALDLLLGKHRTGITSVAIELSKRFREVMVDEYQDSNAVQDAIFTALTHRKQNCFMVGDVKQSIYQFRLADPALFLEKYNTYLPAGESAFGQERKVLLSKNFRSSSGVISAVNDVFSECMSPKVGGMVYGDEEKLYGDETKLPLPDPEVEFYGITVKQDTYAEEAAFVAGRIRQMLDGGYQVRGEDGLRPIVPEDIVILLRSPNSVGGEFAYALEQVGVRCNFGNDQNVLQSEEIQFLRSLLQVIDNPLQDIPLVAVLLSRVFGFTADDLSSLRKQNTSCHIFKLLEREKEGKFSELFSTLVQLRNAARMCTVSELVVKIIVQTKLDRIFTAVNGNADALETFLKIVSQAEQSGHRDISSFISYLDALDERGIPSANNNRVSGMVTILSIHKSKGLEYPVVFLCGLSKGFNREDLKDQVLCDRSLGLGVTYVDTKRRLRYPTIAKRAIALKKSADSLSEELRVLYVAMTRARDRLIMTYASKYLENSVVKLSRRMDFSSSELIASEVTSMGDWILQSAMRRIEAGELFALGGRPATVKTDGYHWKISVVTADQAMASGCEAEQEMLLLSDETKRKLLTILNFTYPYKAATIFPSKQTATQLKGRMKDQEVYEDSPGHKQRYIWRKPSFLGKHSDPLAVGTATHKAFQYIRIDGYPSDDTISAALSSLRDEGLLTDSEHDMIDREAIGRFFRSPLGIRLSSSKNVLREFKFSILVNADEFDAALTEDKVLLQGVVDCAIIDDDGITVIDFKTDSVTEESVAATAESYRLQVKAYADALSRIFNMPVKQAVLYFLHIGKEVEVN